MPMIFSFVLIAGMYFGFKLRENSPTSKGFLRLDKKTSIQEILDLVRLNYVDSVRLDSLQYDAINEMMGHLDPHSVYIPSSHLDEMNEEITGNFEGIGVEFNIFSDTVHILYVLPGGPSDKAGLQIGDRIIKVEGENIAGRSISSDLVKRKIRGQRGSDVDLEIIRSGVPKSVSVTRGTIPVPALDASYLLDQQTGYIKINKFSETAYEEFMASLEDLKKKGIENLVLDLRGNGGGLMNEAVEMVDEFLSGNKLVVYTQGLNSKRQEYNTRRNGLFEEGEVVVLVDELSASASEVVAGALQDWDRALIMGRRTFGKGLVQQQYNLSDGSAVRLTVARYYTPAGRSIQRSYDDGKKVYMDEIWNRYSNGEMLQPDSMKVASGKTYQTIVKKRKVYGGGGIMPDIFVPIDTTGFPQNATRLLTNGTINNFTYNYYIGNRQQIDQYSSPADFNANFTGMDNVWSQFLKYLRSESQQSYSFSEDEREFLQKRMKAQLARFKWRIAGFYQVMNDEDPLIAKALNEINTNESQ